ncbi:flippase-like domain-containing protein [bacterium]|nr:flippase-like domain-containing protein [bacterium]
MKVFRGKNLFYTVSYAVSLIIAITVLYSIGLEKVEENMRLFGWWNFLIAILLCVFRDTIFAWGWHRLIGHKNFLQLWIVNNGGTGINALTPGAMLGEAVKASRLPSKNRFKTVSEIIVLNINYYITTFLMLGVSAFFVIFYFENLPQFVFVIFLSSGIVFLLLSFTLFLMFDLVAELFVSWIIKIPFLRKGKILKTITLLLKIIARYKKGKQKKFLMFENMFWQTLVASMDVFILYFVWKVLVPEVSLMTAFFFFFVTRILGWVTSFIPSGWGVMELAALTVGNAGLVPKVAAIMQQFILRLARIVVALFYVVILILSGRFLRE